MLAERSVAELDAHFARAHAAAEIGSPAAGAMTLLHIGGNRTEVLSGRAESPDTRHTLGIGAEQIARLRRWLPRPPVVVRLLEQAELELLFQ